MTRIGIVTTVIVEIDDELSDERAIKEGQLIAARTAGYLDGTLEQDGILSKRLRVASWTSPRGYVYLDPDHEGEMIVFENAHGT